jgi:hypothetical protein
MAIGVDEIFRIAGVPFSWTSTSVQVEGVPYTGFLEYNFEESREGEYVHAQRPDGTPLGITQGLYKVDSVTFKTLIDTGEQLCSQLALIPGGNGSFGNARFGLTIAIFENPAMPTITIGVNGCKIEKRKFAPSADGGKLVYEFECKALSMFSQGTGIGLSNIPNILANIAANL